MIYYSKQLDRLVCRCDACGQTTQGFKGETDRTELTAVLLKEQGWLQAKEHGKWKQYCPDCKDAYYKSKRERYFG